jgi:Potassium-transporting ATPase A subunit
VPAGITLLNMLLGEVAPGGTGTGLYGILVLAIAAVFLAALMVGRTPEYLGKTLGRVQVTAASISILAMPALVLIGTGVPIALPSTLDALNNDGSHGFSEVLHAYTSTSDNNGRNHRRVGGRLAVADLVAVHGGRTVMHVDHDRCLPRRDGCIAGGGLMVRCDVAARRERRHGRRGRG